MSIQSAKLITYVIGVSAMILAAIAYWVSFYFTYRCWVTSFPGNNEFLEGAGMGLLVGGLAAAANQQCLFVQFKSLVAIVARRLQNQLLHQFSQLKNAFSELRIARSFPQ